MELRPPVRKSFIGALLAALMLCVSPVAIWAQTADDVVCEKCVDTSDLARHSVGTGKMKPESVTSGKIAPAAVTNDKLGTDVENRIAALEVQNADTLDGLDSTDFALAADLANKADVNHDHDGVYQKHYSNMLVVSLDGNGDFTSPLDAMNSITDASAANPYLIRVMPGVYDLGGDTLWMKDNVTLEGSGIDVTVLQGMATVDGTLGVVGATGTNTEVRNLTVTSIGNKGVFASSFALYYNGPGTHRVSSAKLTASPGFGSARGIHVHTDDTTLIANNLEIRIDGISGGGTSSHQGVLCGGSSVLKNIRVTNNVSGSGLLVSGNISLENISVDVQNGSGIELVRGESVGSMRLKNIEVESDYYGLRLVGVGATLHVDFYDSTLSSGLASLRLEDGATMNAANIRIGNGIDNSGGGLLKLVNCFDDNFDPIPNQ